MLRTSQRSSDSDEEPGRERVYFVRARVDPPAEQINSETVANHIGAISNAKAIAAEKKAEHIKRVVAIVEAGNYQVAPFGGLPSCRARILWRSNGSMITPGGIKYEPEEDELDLPFDMPMLVPDQKRDFPDYRDPVQRGHCPARRKQSVPTPR
jgi:hypothetical protein